MSHGARLGLGTVQWGMAYGIADRRGQAPFAEVGNMLRIASEHGISLLDTAHTYGEAEKVLGRHDISSQGFRVVTKVPPIRSSYIDAQAAAQVAAAFQESLQRLRCAQAYGLLVHQAGNLLMPGSDRLWAALQSLKGEGLVEKVGVSVYHPRQLENILERHRIDLVQLPFNLYDQRFAQTGLLRRLKQAGIEVHARSAFLQGVLLLPPDRLPGHFVAIRDHHAHLHHRIGEAGLTPLEACLRFCLARDDIDRVIVGCKTVEQLAEVLGVVKGKDTGMDLSAVGHYSISNESIINPQVWPR